jgi:hypothetical protein
MLVLTQVPLRSRESSFMGLKRNEAAQRSQSSLEVNGVSGVFEAEKALEMAFTAVFVGEIEVRTPAKLGCELSCRRE